MIRAGLGLARARREEDNVILGRGRSPPRKTE